MTIVGSAGRTELGLATGDRPAERTLLDWTQIAIGFVSSLRVRWPAARGKELPRVPLASFRELGSVRLVICPECHWLRFVTTASDPEDRNAGPISGTPQGSKMLSVSDLRKGDGEIRFVSGTARPSNPGRPEGRDRVLAGWMVAKGCPGGHLTQCPIGFVSSRRGAVSACSRGHLAQSPLGSFRISELGSFGAIVLGSFGAIGRLKWPRSAVPIRLPEGVPGCQGSPRRRGPP